MSDMPAKVIYAEHACVCCGCSCWQILLLVYEFTAPATSCSYWSVQLPLLLWPPFSFLVFIDNEQLHGSSVAPAPVSLTAGVRLLKWTPTGGAGREELGSVQYSSPSVKIAFFFLLPFLRKVGIALWYVKDHCTVHKQWLAVLRLSPVEPG